LQDTQTYRFRNNSETFGLEIVMIYHAKKDLLPTIIVWSNALIQTLGATHAALGALASDPPEYGAAALCLVPLASWGVFAFWPIVSTSYEISPTALIIRFGLIRTTIPLKEIVEVTATNAWSGIAWNKVWSLDRLLIRYRLPDGGTALPVAISPDKKEAFLGELKAAVPGLRLVSD
jgi:Bacterial PH domain